MVTMVTMVTMVELSNQKRKKHYYLFLKRVVTMPMKPRNTSPPIPLTIMVVISTFTWDIVDDAVFEVPPPPTRVGYQD